MDINFFKQLWGKATYKPEINLVESQMNELQKKLQTTQKEFQQLQLEYSQYLKETNGMGSGPKDWRRNSILSALFYRGVSKKGEIYKVISQYKENYLYTGIMQLLVEDALSHDPVTNEIVDITSDNKDLDADLRELQERIHIDEIVAGIVEDMLGYGEYFLNISSEEGKGVTEIKDDADQTKLLAVYDGILPKYFLRREKQAGTASVQLKEVSPKEILHFCYGYSKIRIEIDGRQQKEYLRMGKPVMWGTFNLLNYLDTLTALVPAQAVQKLNSTSIIGVSVPEGLDPADALLAAQRYESILNRFTIGEENEQVVSQILSAAGKFKCIPVWGDKGRLENMDPRWQQQMDPALFDELRKSIMASIGIPYNFMFGGGGDKNETLKQFSRYVRKLGMIQKAIRNGLLQLAIIHLVMKSPQRLINVEDIHIKFTNQLLSVEELDKLEFLDTLLGTLEHSVESISKMAEAIGLRIDPNVMLAFLSRYLRIVELENLFVNDPVTGIVPEQDGQGGPGTNPNQDPNLNRVPPTAEDLHREIHKLQSFVESHIKRIKKAQE
jgi:hypothetical protein